ncbi:flippase [Bacillus sinesaloumensis]|uniref:flippase n=1 Tax=Litchfieldia sinesaloumensis TaxID=1926280 RepID=UPI00098842CE|nr:flippase [Bacillus sinesaloumensis]
MSESKQFIKNTLMTISRQISAILIGLLYTVIIARVLGPTGNGIYQLIILLPTMLLTIFNLGIGSSSVYYIGKKNYHIEDILKTNTRSGLLFSFFSVILGALFLLFFSEQFFQDVDPVYLFVILLLMPFLFLNEYYLVIFQGKQDFKSYNMLSLSRQIIALLFTILFLVIIRLDIIGALFAFVLGILAQYLLSRYFLKSRLGVQVKDGVYSKDYFKKSISYGIKAHISNILSFVNYRADIFIISFYINPAAVGIYTAAVSIAERLWIVSQAISSVLFPTVSSLESQDEKNHLTSILSRNVLWLSIISGFIFFLLSDLVVLILFGEEYIESSLAIKLLLPGIVLFSVDRILSNDLAGRGKPEINMNVSIVTVVSNIVLNILLVPHYGIIGAAASTSVTYSLATVIKLFIFKKQTGVKIYKLLIIQSEDYQFYARILKKVKRRKVST